MKRLVLMVIVAGSIMWGMGEICGYAAVPESLYTIRASNSGISTSRHFAQQRIEFFGKRRGRVDNTGVCIFSEGLMIDSSHKNPKLFVGALGNYCTTTEGGCELFSLKRKGERCSCPDGSDGMVIKVGADTNVVWDPPEQDDEKNEPNEPKDIYKEKTKKK